MLKAKKDLSKLTYRNRNIWIGLSVMQMKFLLFPRDQNVFFFKMRLLEYTGN